MGSGGFEEILALVSVSRTAQSRYGR
jgi:hypothetical protein